MASSASKKLLKELPSGEDMENALMGLIRDNAQAAALSSAAYLDNALEILLRAHFRKLNSTDSSRIFDSAPNGILGSFAAKIRLAYAMDLIAIEIFRDLKLINDIRNTFAHTLHKISFDTPQIKTDCAKLASLETDPKMPAQGKYVTTVLHIYITLSQTVNTKNERDALAKSLKGPDSPKP